MRDRERLESSEDERRPPVAAQAPHPHAGVLALQRASGNAAVARALRPAGTVLARQEDQDGPVEVENSLPPAATGGIWPTLTEHSSRIGSLERGDRFSFENWRGMNGFLSQLTGQNDLKMPPLSLVTGHD